MKTEYRGVVYASKSEARYAAHLDLLKRTRRIKGWERQVKRMLVVNDRKICAMVPDFLVHHMDGTHEYVEVKGHPTAVWRLKRKLFEALFPDETYTVIPARKVLGL